MVGALVAVAEDAVAVTVGAISVAVGAGVDVAGTVPSVQASVARDKKARANITFRIRSIPLPNTLPERFSPQYGI